MPSTASESRDSTSLCSDRRTVLSRSLPGKRHSQSLARNSPQLRAKRFRVSSGNSMTLNPFLPSRMFSTDLTVKTLTLEGMHLISMLISEVST